ncbi:MULTISPECIES: SDR family NAD(P)-dependent oxidoreductase [Niastella]|uniref:SDR family oxidoreductase n=1 Tax=Niastella soli TaxID=2821487 RepID=A0ABS3YX16_9BACT|nr:SDR family oxidoreductase [Niastella soli]MBO9202472.1 SDR family oxidoreductase [Niastella soli]
MSYALVTGAAKGIGKGIARELARQGFNLLLIDKDGAALAATKEELESTSGSIVYTLPLDLSVAGSLETITSWTSIWHNELQVVINNAGYGLNGSFEQLSLEEQLNMIDVNIKAQVSLSHAYIPVLKKHRQSFLLNVGSTTCFQSVPYLNVYAASKAFVVSFTRGLRFELKASSVSVSVLIPGSTDTDFVNRARMSDEVKKTAERFNMSPDLVGKIAVRGLFKGKVEIIPGRSNKLHAFFPRFFPKSFVEKIGGKIYKPAVQQVNSLDPAPVNLAVK